MQINVTFDQSQNILPAGFVAAVDFVVNYYDELFTNNVTIDIHVGYGEINGQALGPGDLGESYAPQYVLANYNSVRNALQAQDAPGASALPSSSPLSGSLYLAQAEAQALELTSAVSTSYVGFSSTSPFSYIPNAKPAANQYYFIGVVEHEFSEDMGRVSLLNDQPSYYSPIDLFRFSSPGVRDLTTGGAGSTAYFSTNNGTTHLGNWNNQTSNGDLADWYPSGPAAGGYDAYNDSSSPGVINVVSASDITLMNALGWGSNFTLTGSPSETVVTGDFTGNGKSDIAVTGTGLGGIGTYLSNGNGTFTGVFSPQTGGDWSDLPNAKVVTGDFTGNGETDIAVIDYSLGGIGTYLSNGNGTFNAVFSSQTGTDWSSWPNAKAITGDFTGNGETDIAVIDYGLGGIASYLSNGNGTFNAVYSPQTGTDWSSWPNAQAITGDFTGNGLTDIAVIAGLGGIGNYLSNGNGTFHAVFSPQTGTDWIDWPSAKVVTGNFTSNGETDVAVIAYGLGGIGTYLSNGNGTFHAVYSAQTGTDWSSWPNAQVVTGDFTSNGLTDIAVIDYGLGGIATYLSNGDGTFHAVFSSETGTDWCSWPNATAITGDFTGDGLTDIEVIDPTLGGIAVYLSNGNGTFQAVFSSPAISDQLSTSLAQQTLVTSVWSNSGDGAWSDPSNWSTGQIPGQFDYVNITQPVAVTFDSGNDIIAGLVVSDGATLAVSSHNQLDVSGPLINFGTLDIANGAILQFDDSAITNSGNILVDGTLEVSSLTLNGAGTLTLAGGTIDGSDSSEILDNAGNTISGAGTIGDGSAHLTLDNASGIIEASGGTLIVDTGTSVTNTGTLEAATGATLHVDDAISGTGGSATIGVDATIEFAAADAGSVTFTGSTGTLILDESSIFSGQIFNFTGNGSLSGSDQIDLRDIHYGAIQDSYANGVLTVTDGTDTTNLDFNGSYTLANFKFASDGMGGTVVYDPPAPTSTALVPTSSNPTTTIVSPGPNATLSDHGGNDTFVFAQNFGQATITNFAPGTDAIELSQADFATASAVLAAAHSDGHGNVVIADANHDTITLQNLAVAQIHSSDFLIV